jgi:2-oxoisovalerate dehydrogenase E1 component
VRVAGLAYQKGFGGHFHNDNSLAVFRDLPGVVVACPSNGADAAMMLRTAVREAHENGRVVVFVEPIALYMIKDLVEPGDGGWAFPYPSPEQEIPLGEFGVFGESDELAIISYGNGTYLARQAEHELRTQHGLAAKVIDLRWLAPLDEAKLAAAVDGCGAVLVVDECRRTGSQSEALVTAIVERAKKQPKIARVTAEDCFIPLGRAYTVLLPSKEQIVEAALGLTRKGKGKPATAGGPARPQTTRAQAKGRAPART